jgi:hypothetical protein
VAREEDLLTLARDTVEAVVACSAIADATEPRFRQAAEGVLRILDEAVAGMLESSRRLPTRAFVFPAAEPTKAWTIDAPRAKKIADRLTPLVDRWEHAFPDAEAIVTRSRNDPPAQFAKAAPVFLHLVNDLLFPLWRAHPKLRPRRYDPDRGPS